MNSARCIHDLKSSLGEGPVWNHGEQALYWVDINGQIIYKWQSDEEEPHAYHLPEKVGCLSMRERGGLLLGMENGFFFFDETTEALTAITDPEPDQPDQRFNDGKPDPVGRFYAGTMSPEKGGAAFYRLDTDLEVKRMFGGVTTSNGLAWNLDETKLYYIDTPTKKVSVFDYERSSGVVSNGQTCITVPEGIGKPDGMTIDEEDMLWIAFFGGSIVGRFNPDTGEWLETIDVPASQVTSCTFGGPDLKTLYITTARKNLTATDLEKEPLAGGLFAYETNVRGLPAYTFLG
ncbi:SMP-30/gluconolactonase/LRE family protein [Natribacillus halophilus]|uniref:Sugar lactone lactonase YvrE n=1 Tax=Natribacillus halophilus TaxID=549003 RepID=A0A1G8LLK0_9BACI|nr:SMP-30/gluconolactonase/LRE family protein [Natribacillus halophilus]SDI56505.1 Sugar lactone lactonase YvrE [Natribacillus halophilus]